MSAATYVGGWIHTFTGKRVDPFDMKPEDVEIEHIAHSLATINRFCGAAREPYSVAQHSVLVEERVRARLAKTTFPIHHRADRGICLYALLHDAPEAYGIPDIACPVKGRLWVHYPSVPIPLKRHEDLIMDNICAAFGIPDSKPSIVKNIDNRMVVTEARDLMAAGTEGWEWSGPEPSPYPERVLPWAWWRAKDNFLARFRELTE